MSCRDFERLRALLSLVPEILSRPLKARLDRHAEQCHRCRRFARRYEELPGLLRRAYQGEVTAYVAPSPAPAVLFQRRRRRAGLRLVLAGMAVAALACVAAATRTHFTGIPQPTLAAGGRKEAPCPTMPHGGSGGTVATGPIQHGHPGFLARHKPGQAVLAPEVARDRRKGSPSQPGDVEYLDGRDPHLASAWMIGDAENAEVLGWLRRPIPPMKDEFVHVPLPRLASTGADGVAEAIHNYEQEANVVDTRLVRRVTLACKAMPLDELCARLSEQTGVKIQAARGVQDEKVTIFVEDRPAREVMREVARLFGYLFTRSGEPNGYRYELAQDLRSQLAEDELRNKDVHEALIALDGKMAEFRPYLSQDVDAVIARTERSKDGKDAEASRLFRLARGGWGPAQLYFRLTPAEHTALVAGKELRCTLDDPNPDRRLPAGWKESLLKTSGLRLFPSGLILENVDPGVPSTPVCRVPDMEPSVLLRLDRSEAGEFSLKGETSVAQTAHGKRVQGGVQWEIARGRNPAARPDNARLNAALKNDPLFQAKISLLPTPSCPFRAEDAGRTEGEGPERSQPVFEPELREAHVSSADVWEEIHRRTHLPVVADAYTHLFPLSKFKLKDRPTFGALCQAGDEMGVRWRKDGDYLLGRSASYFWDKTKEVPARFLKGWQTSREQNHGLPLEALLQMATLSDQQLGSHTVGLGITHCWGLDEWGIIGGGPIIAGEIVPEEMRKMARALTVLTPAQLAQARKPEGLSPKEVTPQQALVVAEKLGWSIQGPGANRLHVDYVPGGRYVWRPRVTQERYNAEAKRWPHVSAATRDEALAAARKWDPKAAPGSISRTRGRLDIVFITPQGEWLGSGGPIVNAPLE